MNKILPNIIVKIVQHWPEAVGEREVVLQRGAGAGVAAGVRRGPLRRGEARHDPDGEGDHEVGKQDVQPDVQGKRVHEAAHSRAWNEGPHKVRNHGKGP